MKFREKMKLAESICEYHWENGVLVVFVNDYEFESFMSVLKEHNCLFDDEGIAAYLRNGYVCVPEFDNILEMLGLDIEEIKEMFEEGGC